MKVYKISPVSGICSLRWEGFVDELSFEAKMNSVTV